MIKSIIKRGMKFLIYPQTSTVAPLNFGNGLGISAQNLLMLYDDHAWGQPCHKPPFAILVLRLHWFRYCNDITKDIIHWTDSVTTTDLQMLSLKPGPSEFKLTPCGLLTPFGVIYLITTSVKLKYTYQNPSENIVWNTYCHFLTIFPL